ncbi:MULTISPECIES: helix-turn-helix domain-containing protein [Lactiplantibacillus]|uniref:Helix-turn-helix domain-containing protein n=2 Tax=Lactiplantibacillus TaxID=2767842 RepID=A0ABW1R7C5_9LACO|nr:MULTISPECIES: helix-turn-helix domain-containing protein [Lactiplantibacillus]
MQRGRRASYEERLEIVNYTLAHENNYQQAADKYNVSYPQVYTWVRKFRQSGAAGLVDHRGRPKQTPQPKSEN